MHFQEADGLVLTHGKLLEQKNHLVLQIVARIAAARNDLFRCNEHRRTRIVIGIIELCVAESVAVLDTAAVEAAAIECRRFVEIAINPRHTVEETLNEANAGEADALNRSRELETTKFFRRKQ